MCDALAVTVMLFQAMGIVVKRTINVFMAKVISNPVTLLGKHREEYRKHVKIAALSLVIASASIRQYASSGQCR